ALEAMGRHRVVRLCAHGSLRLLFHNHEAASVTLPAGAHVTRFVPAGRRNGNRSRVTKSYLPWSLPLDSVQDVA
ncbi:MAG TPA: hypothetical protein VK356_08500, partial [Thermomicrobiales bacterium]|nr:hypothetical protein [Thermomicrobiales bacterium]